jgi:UDP-N-acetylmuramoylalanine--D-glutamate ligase
VPLLPVSAVQLSGRHLLADVLAATAVGTVAGLPAEAMRRAVERFTGLEHALECVATIDEVTFVNDSKATNVVSARRAIETFGEGLVVIMGGRYKGGAFDDLCEPLAERRAVVVTIGEASEQIRTALGSAVPVRHAATMHDAVRLAFSLASPGATVLLAPACSSFDMFKDYAARGRAFTDEVRQIEGRVSQTLGPSEVQQ